MKDFLYIEGGHRYGKRKATLERGRVVYLHDGYPTGASVAHSYPWGSSKDPTNWQIRNILELLEKEN